MVLELGMLGSIRKLLVSFKKLWKKIFKTSKNYTSKVCPSLQKPYFSYKEFEGLTNDPKSTL